MLPTPPYENRVTANTYYSFFVPETTVTKAAMSPKRGTQVPIKGELGEDDVEYGSMSEPEGPQDDRQIYDRLREELKELSRLWFTPAEANNDAEELTSATIGKYYKKNAKGKWTTNSKTAYLSDLDLRFKQLRQAWRKAGVDRDGVKEILEMMNEDPARYEQANLEDLVCVYTTALQRKKMSAERKLKDHRAKAISLIHQKWDEEKQVKNRGSRQRRVDTMVRGEAELKRKTPAKTAGIVKVRSAKANPKAQPARGRRR